MPVRGKNRMIAFMGLLLLTLGNSSAQTSTAEDVAASATRQIQMGQFQSASDSLEGAVHTYPNAVELWNLLGISDTELHRGAAAKAAFERGLQLAPDSVSLNENMGFLLFREADYGPAKKYLQRAIDLGSGNPGVRFSLAAAELRTGGQSKR